jgi:hypothetical protein
MFLACALDGIGRDKQRDAGPDGQEERRGVSRPRDWPTLGGRAHGSKSAARPEA